MKTFFLALLPGTMASLVLPAAEFNAATFNLRNAPSENSNSWQIRAPAAKALVRFHEFDIFGVQEAYLHQIKTLAGDEYAYIGAGRDDGKTAGEHSAILYKKSLFKCLENGDFWFSPTPEKPSMGWGARYRRICSWGKFKCLESGKAFFVFNLHLDHESALAQKNSVEMLVQNVKKSRAKLPI
ncbi:MAG: endonuclease/exonuclease/phosphatase family protein [Opitutales bacterium]|nr:endonuclease/exonuclease/phosphatase family protein [Opitutales bacterium]